MGKTHGERNRQQGIELGRFRNELDDHSYPTTAATLIEEYGDFKLELPNGSETVRDILSPIGEESYESADEVEQTILNMVGEKAIGRKGYSDRTPPALGEDREDEQQSF